MKRTYYTIELKIAFVITYFIVLFNYPITTVIISLILIALYYNIMSDSSQTNRPDKWVNGYTKKDGTYVNGHWKRKRNKY